MLSSCNCFRGAAGEVCVVLPFRFLQAAGFVCEVIEVWCCRVSLRIQAVVCITWVEVSLSTAEPFGIVRGGADILQDVSVVGELVEVRRLGHSSGAWVYDLRYSIGKGWAWRWVLGFEGSAVVTGYGVQLRGLGLEVLGVALPAPDE